MDIRALGGFQPIQGPSGVGFNQPIARPETTQQPVGDQVLLGGQSDLGLMHNKMMIIDNKEVVTSEAPAKQEPVAEKTVASEVKTPEKGINRNPSVLTLGDDDSFYGDFGKTSMDFAFGPNNLGSLKGVLNNVDFGGAAAGNKEVNWGMGGKTLTQGLE